MKIKPKIMLLTSLFSLVLVAFVSYLAIDSIQVNSQREINNYKEEALAQVKQALQEDMDIAYGMVERQYRLTQNPSYIEQNYGSRVESAVTIGYSAIEYWYNQAQRGLIDVATAQQNAKNQIRNFRYDNGTGYLWINNNDYPYPTMLMHPTVPRYEGQLMNSEEWNNVIGTGENLFTRMVKELETKDSAYVAYEWFKPVQNGLTEKQPKISFVTLFEPWQWIVGSGVYFDDAIAAEVESIKNSLRNVSFADGEGYFWVLNTERQYPTLLVHGASESLEGVVMNTPSMKNSALNGTADVGTAFVDTAVNQGQGFVDYLWLDGDNPANEKRPKLAIVRYYQPLDWVIGTAVYTDHIDRKVAEKEAQVKEQTNKLIRDFLIVVVIALVIILLLSYWLAHSISSPIVKLSQVSQDISLGKNLDKSIEGTKRKDEIGQLSRSVERLQRSVKMMLNRMKK